MLHNVVCYTVLRLHITDVLLSAAAVLRLSMLLLYDCVFHRPAQHRFGAVGAGRRSKAAGANPALTPCTALWTWWDQAHHVLRHPFSHFESCCTLHWYFWSMKMFNRITVAFGIYCLKLMLWLQGLISHCAADVPQGSLCWRGWWRRTHCTRKVQTLDSSTLALSLNCWETTGVSLSLSLHYPLTAAVVMKDIQLSKTLSNLHSGLILPF